MLTPATARCGSPGRRCHGPAGRGRPR
jgi:hypothetical protein